MKQKLFIIIGIICYIIVFCICDIDRIIPAVLLVITLIIIGSIFIMLGIQEEKNTDSVDTERNLKYAEEFQKLYNQIIINRLFDKGGDNIEN